MPKVLNKRQSGFPNGAIYVGRPSKWGNPFTHLPRGTAATFRVATREEAVARYRWWITEGGGKYLLDDLHELRGKDLVCWCAPQDCHADVLLELANAVTPETTEDCLSCGEGMPRGECPKSPRGCGHHCNCSWIQDHCDFCGANFGEEGEIVSWTIITGNEDLT